MRTRLALALFLGTATLPSVAYAQYPAQGYYYPQPYGYQNPYPQYQQSAYPAPGYYYPQPMQGYPRTYAPGHQGMPVYPQRTWQPMPARQDNHVILSPIPTTAPAPRSGVLPNTMDPPVRQAGKKPGLLPTTTSAPDKSKGDSNSAKPMPVLETPGAEPKAALKPFLLAGTLSPQPDDAPKTTLTPVTISEANERRRCRLMAFGDYLYWNVHGADVPFAQQFDGIAPLLAVPRGPVAMVSPEYKTGFRAGAGFGIADGVSIVGTFTYFFTETDAETSAGGAFVLRNFLAFPNTANAAVDSLTSSANYKINLIMGDIDGKFSFCNSDRVSIVGLIGGRYAHLDQNVLNTFQVTGTNTVDSKINFDGFGPRIGLESQWRIKGGCYAYANGVVDLLFGEFRGSYEQRSTFTGLVGLTSISTNRVVPILELEVGAGWESRSGRCRVSGGYYVGSWYNTMTTNSLAGAIGNANFMTNGNNFRDNLVFDGLVGRFEFRY